VGIENRELNFLKRCSLFVVIIGVILILTSVAVLIGWQYNIPVLTSILPSWVSMKINTAICFFLSGCTLLLLNKKPKFTNVIVVALSLVMLMISTATIIEYLLGVDFGIDYSFKKEIILNPKEQYPGRMAFITAFSFFLIGVEFLFNKQKTILINQVIVDLPGFLVPIQSREFSPIC
jgi:hypothetical protein